MIIVYFIHVNCFQNKNIKRFFFLHIYFYGDFFNFAFMFLGDYDSTNGRENANNIDLNRNFPDQFGITKDNEIQQPETSAVMKWILSEPFVLSANLHGGSLVANYPYDDNVEKMDGIYSKSPDDILFRRLAAVYSNVSSVNL